MNTNEIIEDIKTLDIFESEELEPCLQNDSSYHVFKSWEYYQIIYLSNADLYYIAEGLDEADEIHETPNGRIYCFK